MKKRISIIGGGVSGLGAALLAKSKNQRNMAIRMLKKM